MNLAKSTKTTLNKYRPGCISGFLLADFLHNYYSTSNLIVSYCL